MRIKVGSRVRVKGEVDCPLGTVIGYDHFNGERIFRVVIPSSGSLWFFSSELEVVR